MVKPIFVSLPLRSFEESKASVRNERKGRQFSKQTNTNLYNVKIYLAHNRQIPLFSILAPDSIKLNKSRYFTSG